MPTPSKQNLQHPTVMPSTPPMRSDRPRRVVKVHRPWSPTVSQPSRTKAIKKEATPVEETTDNSADDDVGCNDHDKFLGIEYNDGINDFILSITEEVARKRKSFSIKEKLDILKEVEKGSKRVDICRKYGISASTLSTFVKHRDAFVTASRQNLSELKRLRGARRLRRYSRPEKSVSPTASESSDLVVIKQEAKTEALDGAIDSDVDDQSAVLAGGIDDAIDDVVDDQATGVLAGAIGGDDNVNDEATCLLAQNAIDDAVDEDVDDKATGLRENECNDVTDDAILPTADEVIGRVIRKRKSFSVKEKLAVLAEVETGRKKVDICREYDISMSTLSSFMNHKDVYRTAFQESRCKARKLRRSNAEDLSRALLRWYHQSSALGIPINGPLLRNKAQHLARCLGYQDFTVSTSWIHRFRRRHCLNEHDQQYKNARQDLSDADAWLTTSWPLISSGYSPWDIFSAVEVGILFRVLPGNARQFRGSICEQGQCADERLTVFLCANMAGDEKRPLLAVGCGPLSNPAAASSVRYGFNERAWMTRDIFVEELKRWDCELDARKRKILLLVDHCPCHLVSGKVDLRNIEVVYPPPNKGGNLLPLDHGVVQVFKRRYRKVLLVHSVLQKVPRPPPLEEALRLLNSAWKKVKGLTVRLAFAACGLHSDSTFDDCADDSDNIPLEEWASRFNLREDLVSGIWEYDCIDDFLVTSGKLEAEGLHAYPGAVAADVSASSEEQPSFSLGALDAVGVLMEFCEKSASLSSAGDGSVMEALVELRTSIEAIAFQSNYGVKSE
ncbi:tigger transposable element-derived protein 4 [Ixodes scapularis]|uniref:tigger transposable element-derived protein 4 n=1 Tax=Ixodes scapularis TaxID=6945 RepID=UPI001C37E8FE|nr:tigger transposable element-derived protein 4 [Ixodes scapularis]XP_029849889.3 tigger transposable element-derived protein 4 [Ixodes scapularis]